MAIRKKLRRKVIRIVEGDIQELASPQDQAPAAPSDDLGEESERKVQMVCTAADEFKARDIVILDVRGLTTLADFFVMCTGTSTTHIQSIAEGVR
ncbi:MAG: RsfS/YbeB/iojap family protein, partial [Armatimonadota bacterium]|nr:RsfS/YbeB/iojap family protein [Armatimonadota bacterium]